MLRLILQLAILSNALASAVEQWPPALTFPDNTPPAGIDVWCGKAYRPTDPAFPDLVERGALTAPARDEKRIEFTCTPRLKPYVEDNGQGAFIITAAVTNDVGAVLAEDIVIGDGKQITVVIKAGEKEIAREEVAVSEDIEISFGLKKLAPESTPYEVTCSAFLEEVQLAKYTTQLLYLPLPESGNVVALDFVTGNLLITHNGSAVQPFFPIGYYISWGDYLATNYSSLLPEIKAAGYTILHPIPGGGSSAEAWGPNSLALFSTFLDAAFTNGLYVQYDMRHTFTSASEVETQVAAFKGHPALLTWYTGDEPDGDNHATNATYIAYKQLTSLDPYHPVAIVLNCQNYFFPQYIAGADIVLADVYNFGNRLDFSEEYGTVCNTTYGCCGADNIWTNDPLELTRRIQQWKEFARWSGVRKVWWGVGQALGGTMFWKRWPTEQEIVKQAKKAVEGGASGMLWWSQPTEEGVWRGSSKVAASVRGKDSNREGHDEL